MRGFARIDGELVAATYGAGLRAWPADVVASPAAARLVEGIAAWRRGLRRGPRRALGP